MSVKLTFLGTGASFGVPMLGCKCRVCRSNNPRNKRTRTSALISVDGHNILIDASPDFRCQALINNVDSLDAVLFTHSHADHTFGIDDLRAFSLREPITCYGDESTVEAIRRRFDYIFSPTPHLGSRPKLRLHSIKNNFRVSGLEFVPLPIRHGLDCITAYMFEGIAYITDASEIPEVTLQRIKSVDVLVLNALRFEPHAMHLGLWQAVDLAKTVGAERTYLVHLGHDLDYDEVSSMLPDGVQLAYDGLQIEV